MKRSELYHKTVDILVQAYFNDTLLHHNCRACAIGNIVAANKGIKLYKDRDGSIVSDGEANNSSWYAAIGINGIDPEYITYEEVAEQIRATGYTPEEVFKIEYAFEVVNHSDDADKWMFDGLMNVIDALDEIHENNDDSVSKESKQRFNRIVAVELCDATTDDSSTTAH